MKHRIIVKASLAALLVVTLPACQLMEDIGEGIEDIFDGDDGGPAQVDDLVGSIERVYVNSELAKERMNEAVVALQTMVDTNFEGDAVTSYAAYSGAVERAEEQAEVLRESLVDMEEAAEPVFEQWHDNLKDITNVKMRQRSRTRLMATRERYDRIIVAAEPALAAFDTVNKSMRDHALFLGNDLNPASVSLLTDDVKSLAMASQQVEREFDECLVAARAYVDAASLPVKAEPRRSTPNVVPVSGETEKRPLLAQPIDEHELETADVQPDGE